MKKNKLRMPGGARKVLKLWVFLVLAAGIIALLETKAEILSSDAFASTNFFITSTILVS